MDKTSGDERVCRLNEIGGGRIACGNVGIDEWELIGMLFLDLSLHSFDLRKFSPLMSTFINCLYFRKPWCSLLSGLAATQTPIFDNLQLLLLFFLILNKTVL